MRGIGIYCLIGLFLAEAPPAAAEDGRAWQAGRRPSRRPRPLTKPRVARRRRREGHAGSREGDGAAPAVAGRQGYEPVSFKELQRFLPDISGWEKETPQGETMTARSSSRRPRRPTRRAMRESSSRSSIRRCRRC